MYARRKSAAIVLSLSVVALFAWLSAAAVASEAPALTLTAGPAKLTCGAKADLKVRDAAPGASLLLYRKRAAEADFLKVGEVVANGSGGHVWVIRPSQTTVYRVEQAAGPTWEAASAEVTVGVRHGVTLTATAKSPLLQGKDVRYVVTVRPSLTTGSVQLQRWDGENWQALTDVELNGDSRGAVRLPAGKPGALKVRAFMPADAEHLAGTSEVWRQTVYDKRNPYGVPAKYAHLILVDLSKYKLYYHEHGVLIRAFDCVLGRPSLPTPRGHFKIYAKDPHIGGPYGPFRMRYLGLYAIHGTNEPWLLSRYPRNYSHGCTRLSNTNITWLYQRVPVGTPVWNVP